MAFRVRWKSQLGNSPDLSISKLADIADAAMIASVPQIARLWQKAVKAMSPVGATGNLKRQFKIKPIKGSTKVTLQHVWYTFIVDHRKPFILQALYSIRPQALRIISREFLKRIS